MYGDQHCSEIIISIAHCNGVWIQLFLPKNNGQQQQQQNHQIIDKIIEFWGGRHFWITQ